MDKKEIPKLIPLTQNQYAIVDADMYDYLNQWKWQAQQVLQKFYASRGVRDGDKKILIMMTHLILPPKKGYEHDHKNGNSLDNRISNLRLATHSENLSNSIKHNEKREFSSKYKGVSKAYFQLKKQKQTWFVNIMYERKRYYLGVFDNEIEAAKAYDRKALELFGEFARINFPKK